MIAAIWKAIGQLDDPRVRKVIGMTLALVMAAFVALVVFVYFLIGWLVDLSAWLEGLAQFGGVAAAVIVAWFTFPAAAAAIAALFADQVIDAVEDRHYPGLPAPHPQPIAAVVLDGLKLGGISLVANLLALPFLIIPPLYALIAWAINGWLLGREYFEMVAFRRLSREEARVIYRQNVRTFTLAGIVIAVSLTIPFINMVAPILGAAFMVHVAGNVINLGRNSGDSQVMRTR